MKNKGTVLKMKMPTFKKEGADTEKFCFYYEKQACCEFLNTSEKQEDFCKETDCKICPFYDQQTLPDILGFYVYLRRETNLGNAKILQI